MTGTMPPLPIYAFMPYTEITLAFIYIGIAHIVHEACGYSLASSVMEHFFLKLYTMLPVAAFQEKKLTQGCLHVYVADNTKLCSIPEKLHLKHKE
jgi:hypothetical protein